MMPRRLVGRRYAARADSPGFSGARWSSAPRVPPTGSRRRSTGVRRLPRLVAPSSTRVASPAWTRVGERLRATRIRTLAARTYSRQAMGKMAITAPATYSSMIPKARAAMSTPAATNRITHPWRVSTVLLPRGHRDRAQDVGHDLAGGEALQLGVGRERETVREHGVGE